MNYASRACLGLCLLLLTGIFPAQADIKNPSDLERAPVPQPVRISINRGETATITLSAVTASSRDVTFLLRSQPNAGKILDPEPVRKTKNTATFRYQSDPSSQATQEVIKFVARVVNGAVSPSETVTINIMEIRPVLELPAKLEVGQVRFGQQGEAAFVVANVGNGPFDQIVPLPEGWSWVGSDRLVVPAGKIVEMKLRFTPRSLGSSVSMLKLGESPKSQMTLVGYGLSPVDFSGVVTLAWDKAKAQRTLEAPMRNPSDVPLVATLTGPEGKLRFPDKISLPPNTTVPVHFLLSDIPAAPLHTQLTLTVNGISQTITVTAQPAPAEVELVGFTRENIVDFGAVAAEELAAAQKKLLLINKGGQSVSVFGDLPESYTISGFEPGMTLAPGMEIPITISIKPSAAGRLQDHVKWTWDKAPMPFQLHAEILNVRPESIARPSNLSPDTSADPDISYEPLETSSTQTIDSEMRLVRDGLLPSSMKINAAVPKITELHQISNTANSITLAWFPVKGDTPYTYEVLHRKVGFSGGFPIVVWMPVTNVTYGKSGKEITATIGGLKAENGSNGYRIATKAADGTYSIPTDPLPFGVPFEEETDWVKWFLIASPFLLWGLWRWWRKRETPLPRSYRSRIEGESTLGENL